MPLDGTSSDSSREALGAWQKVLASTSTEVMAAVHAVIEDSVARIVDKHYQSMLAHPRACVFLSHEVVDLRLRASMKRWLARTFGAIEPKMLTSAVAFQVEIGEVHARIKLPPDLMSVGVRTLKAAILEEVLHAFDDPADRLTACMYVNDVIHLADGLMNSAYVRIVQKSVRNDEAYRTIALKHDAALERERQRAALSEWAQKFLFTVGRRSRRATAVPLGQSEFALWMKHKAHALFDGMPDVRNVYDAMAHVDDVIVPQLSAAAVTEERMERLVEDLERQVEFIRYLVGDLFDRLNQIEEGRDSVTRLFNRRYLLSILSRELEEHRKGSQPFGVMVVRIDDSAKYGEDGGSRNLLLQRVALTIQSSVRSGDHVFRYGDDEFLVIVVESTENDATWLANRIRNDVRAQTIMMRTTPTDAATVSLGLAMYDGHPDYQRLLDRAAEALDAARARGGNCFEIK